MSQSDLTPDQRSRLHGIALEHHQAWQELSDAMAKIVSESPFAGMQSLSREAGLDLRNRREEVALLESRRAELAGAVLVQMRQVLTPAQFASLEIEV